MVNHTHTPVEWAAFLSLGLSLASATAIPFVLYVNADHFAWPNPRAALAGVVASGRLDPLLIVIGPALLAIRDTALDVAALLLLLTTSPKGAMA